MRRNRWPASRRNWWPFSSEYTSWLGDESTPGLGGHLYRELGGSVPVVGVAKSWMRKAAPTAEVYRGESRRPLYVSAAGIDLDVACRHVEGMHGEFRMPTILGRVDQLSRGLVAPGE